MKKFKIGDKVKIPKKKSIMSGIKSSLEELENYKLDYLVVSEIENEGTEVILRRDDGTYGFGKCRFLNTDLEPYGGEKMEKKLIGYKCPEDFYNSGVKKGEVVSKVNEPQFGKGEYRIDKDDYVYYLPKEIVETWEPVYEENFKVGDWVTCKNGNPFKSIRNDTVRITKMEDGKLWSKDHVGESRLDYERFAEVYRKATPEEIEAASSVVIGGHTAEKKGGDAVAFGCQEFSSSELGAIQRLFHKEINARITIHGVEITNDMITKLLQL